MLGLFCFLSTKEKIANFQRSILLLLVIDITSKTVLLNNIAGDYRFTTQRY